MCLQGKERKWAEKDLRNLAMEKAARNYEESKLKQMSSLKENKIVSLLELSIKSKATFYALYSNH